MSDLARYLAGDNYLTRSASGIKRGLSALADSLTARSNEGIENMGAALSGVRVRPGAVLTDAGYVMPDASGQPDFSQVGIEREPDTLRLLELFGSAMAPVKGATVAAKSGAGGKVAADVAHALPMDEASRMARAREMGFNVDMPVYHGRYADFPAFKEGRTAYFTSNPEYASQYTNPSASSLGKSAVDLENLQPNVVPAYIKTGEMFDTRNPSHREIFERDFFGKYGNKTPLTERGLPDWVDAEDFQDFFADKGMPYKGVVVDEGGVPLPGGGVQYRGESYAVFDPSNIRSRFAAFDPASANESDLLALRANLGPIVNALLQGYDRR